MHQKYSRPYLTNQDHSKLLKSGAARRLRARLEGKIGDYFWPYIQKRVAHTTQARPVLTTLLTWFWGALLHKIIRIRNRILQMSQNKTTFSFYCKVGSWVNSDKFKFWFKHDARHNKTKNILHLNLAKKLWIGPFIDDKVTKGLSRDTM